MIRALRKILTNRLPQKREKRPQLFEAFEQIKNLRIEQASSKNGCLILITGSEDGGKEVTQLLSEAGEYKTIFSHLNGGAPAMG